MIKVRNLSFSYTKQPFLENINFEVGEGEILGFLGPPEQGKVLVLEKIKKCRRAHEEAWSIL